MQGLELLKKYIPDEKNLVSLGEIVAEGEKNKIPVTIRWLRYNISHRVLQKPMKIGKKVYFDKDYIYPAITCIFILRGQFWLRLSKIRKIMSANGASVEVLLDRIKLFLDKYTAKDKRPSYYDRLEKRFLEMLGEENLAIDFDKLEKEAKEAHKKNIKGAYLW